MKKTLLATTAIVGVAFLTQSVLAEGLSVTGGVKFKWSLSKVLDETRGGLTVVDKATVVAAPTASSVQVEATDLEALDINTGFGVDSYELTFKGSKDLANGMSIGMVASYKLDSAKRASYYGYLSGGFGELKFGNVESAADTLVVGADFVSGEAATVGAVASAIGETADGVTINSDSGEGDVKLAYYSPVFAGVKAGLSYALASVTGDNFGRAVSHKIGVGVNYASDFGTGGAVELGLGFAASLAPEADEKAPAETVNKVDMGLQVGAAYSIAGATISLAYSVSLPGDLQAEAKKGAEAAVQAVDSSLTLTEAQPMAVEASVVYDFGAGDVSIGGRYGLHGKASVIAGGLGVGYTVVDGFKTNLDIAYSLASNGLTNTFENKKSSIGVALSAGVSF